jgi:ribosomal protein RSM22 (predicted rRNA methylase)
MSQGVPKTRAEVKDLQRLRQLFLEAPGRQGLEDYWQDESLLSLYDATYARRIGWKWEAVLAELESRGWQIPANIRRWLDWGCGSGIAAETLIQFAAGSLPDEIVVSDRSRKAMQFSSQKLAPMVPNCKVTTCLPENAITNQKDLVLISHVLTELPQSGLETLMSRIMHAGVIVWVEPGTPFCSQRLLEVRARLKDTFAIVAPCPHQKSCPLETREGDWCHFFAPPPPIVFQDSFWATFAKEMNIDLRSLPVSFLVLQNNATTGKLPSGLSQCKRLIARPRFLKGHAKAMFCNSQGNATIEDLPQKKFKREFKEWERDCFFVQLTSDQDSD